MKLRLAILLLVAALPFPAASVDIQRIVSGKGIAAWFVHDRSVPLIALSFAFRGAGWSSDPDGKEGLADMATALLDEGAGDIDSQSFQRALEETAARLSFDADTDDLSGRMQTLVSERDRAFRLLRLALTAPRFDSGPVDRIRSQIVASLRVAAEDPRRIGGRLWRRAVFPRHVYGRPGAGTEESVSTISPEDLGSYARNRFGRDRLVVGVVGDISAAELKERLDEVFGDLPASAPSPEIPRIVPAAAGKTLIVRKRVPQSTMVFGHAGVARDDPDWYAALLVTEILGGGGMNSRLHEAVRNKRGLAYSVYAYLNPLDRAALVAGGVATRNARAGEALETVRAEWRRIAGDGVTEEELRDAKTHLNGSFPLRFDSGRRIADMLVGIQLARLGIDYVDSRRRLIDSVTLEQANRVARRIFRAEDLTVVVVGDPEDIAASP